MTPASPSDFSSPGPETVRIFTGGPFETNAFLIALREGYALIDAPEGALHWLTAGGHQVDLLLLTHSHFDHVVDAAAIKEHFSCPCAYHPDCAQMDREVEQFRAYGLNLSLRPVKADILLPGDEENRVFLGEDFRVLHVPGHHPGSLCFLWKEHGLLFGGDVLFHGGIGRWDFPGGDLELLTRGIRTKLYPLDAATTVYPGHGPPTTIGKERESNPFVTWDGDGEA